MIWEILRLLRKWKNGKISGKIAAKNILKIIGTNASGFGGATFGALIGSIFGPAGTIIFGIAGGVGASEAAKKITVEFLGLTKNNKLQKAFNNVDINLQDFKEH